MLGGLLGADVRVGAKSFSPTRWTGRGKPPRLIPVCDLFLPDDSQPAGLPVFFEGRLQHFERRIGVVLVCLESPASTERAPDGPVYFRGQTAVILRGPAVVQLAFPFHVERLPAHPDNYWRDLRAPCAQFELPFATDGDDPGHDPGSRSADSPTHLKAAAPASVHSSRRPERRLAPGDLPPRSAVDRTDAGTPSRGNDASHSEAETKPRFTA